MCEPNPSLVLVVSVVHVLNVGKIAQVVFEEDSVSREHFGWDFFSNIDEGCYRL